jgi:DNA polymerase
VAAATDGSAFSHPGGAPRSPSLTFAGADPVALAGASVAAAAVHAASTGDPRHVALAELAVDASACTRCRLAQGRTQVVFGVGNPDAELMFVGEAPGFHEDKQGFPFVGQAGKLLDRLLGGIGLTREDVYIANCLKCRPPGNRDPMPDEIEACESYLFRQVGLIEPALIATLGNFATKLLSGRPDGITKVHGRPQPARLGEREVTLYPIYHPAAALYTPAMLRTLEEDFARIPELLASARGGAPRSPAPQPDLLGALDASGEGAARTLVAAAAAEPSAEQLGLF